MRRIGGRLLTFERPERMSVDEFLGRPGAGELVAAGWNLIVDQWWNDLFTSWVTVAGGGTATIDQRPTNLLLGNGVTPVPHTGDTALVAQFKSLSLVGETNVTGPPPSTTFSFFSPGSDGAYTVTEAGLAHDGGTRLMTHLAYSYSKAAGVDSRFDYPLPRG